MEKTKQNLLLKAGITAFAVITAALVLWALDWKILFFIQNSIRNSVLDIIVPFYTKLGNSGMLSIVTGVMLLLFKKTRKCGIAILLALLGGLLIVNWTIKPIVARPRPCHYYPELLQLVGQPSEFSFPSGHTVSAFAAAVPLYRYHKKAGIVGMILAAFMGLSRLYVFVHFPTDVFMGFVIGSAISMGVCFGVDKLYPRVEKLLSEKLSKKKA